MRSYNCRGAQSFRSSLSLGLLRCVCPMLKRAAPHDAVTSPNKRQRTTRPEVIDLTMSSDESVAGPSRPRVASHALVNGSAPAVPTQGVIEGLFASIYKAAEEVVNGFRGGMSTTGPLDANSPD